MPAQCTTKPLEYEGHDRLPWSGIHPGARASRPHLVPANSLPTTATLLQSAPSPPLRGSLRSCQVLCGRDARAPGWSFSARVWASARLMAETAIKSTCSLGVESVPALEELAGGWEVSKSEVLRRAPVCVRKDIPPGARASRPHLIPANSLPTTATLLQSAPSPPLGDSLRSCQVLCGRDARAPGWSFSARVWASARLMAVQTINTTCSLGVESVLTLEESARRWEVSKSEVLRRAPVCVRKNIPPGARASRPHPYSCKQPAIHGHSFAKRTKPAITGISSIVPGFVRAGRPRSQGVFFGKSLGIG